MYNSTKRYAYRVDLNIDVAITSYSTRIAGFLFVVLRYDTVLLEYTTRTVLYLYSYEHGEYCLKYSTVRVQYSAVQSRTRTSTSKRGA